MKHATVSCGRHCGHSAAEHRAFDLGLRHGEAGWPDEDCPVRYRRSPVLRETWLAGRSVGAMNRPPGRSPQDH